MWNGGSEQQLMTPFPRMPKQVPNGSKLLCIPALGDSVALRRDVFVYLFMTAPSRTPTFKTISEGSPSRNGLKRYGFA